MTLLEQITWGSLFLGMCFVIEIMLLVWCTFAVEKNIARIARSHYILRMGVPIAITLFFIVLAHTLQVWLWAIVWVWFDVLDGFNTAIYFSLVTYTTLGYGDIVLGEELRIFAAFAAVAGLLAFGLSTAYLVALMSRIFKAELNF